jgi:hypothetical protein
MLRASVSWLIHSKSTISSNNTDCRIWHPGSISLNGFRTKWESLARAVWPRILMMVKKPVLLFLIVCCWLTFSVLVLLKWFVQQFINLENWLYREYCHRWPVSKQYSYSGGRIVPFTPRYWYPFRTAKRAR